MAQRNGKQQARFRLDDQIGHLLRCAYLAASGALVEQIRDHDLTPQQFATLARLNEDGRLSQNLLGRRVAMDPANIRDTVSRLKRRGLVKTESDKADRRLQLVSLTPAGRRLVDALAPLAAAGTRRVLAAFTESERKRLYGFLRAIASGADGYYGRGRISARGLTA